MQSQALVQAQSHQGRLSLCASQGCAGGPSRDPGSDLALAWQACQAWAGQLGVSCREEPALAAQIPAHCRDWLLRVQMIHFSAGNAQGASCQSVWSDAIPAPELEFLNLRRCTDPSLATISALSCI